MSLKNIIAVLAGVIVGTTLIYLVEALGHLIWFTILGLAIFLPGAYGGAKATEKLVS